MCQHGNSDWPGRRHLQHTNVNDIMIWPRDETDSIYILYIYIQTRHRFTHAHRRHRHMHIRTALFAHTIHQLLSKQSQTLINLFCPMLSHPFILSYSSYHTYYIRIIYILILVNKIGYGLGLTSYERVDTIIYYGDSQRGIFKSV